MPDTDFPSKRLTYLLEIIANEAIAGNDAIFLRDLGYSIRELRVLRIVDDNPGVTFVDVWDKSGLERSLTSRILQKLIGDDLLVRTSSGTDARKYHLSTSAAGKALRQRGRAVSDALEGLLLEIFSPQDRSQFFEQLERLGHWVRSDDYKRALQDYPTPAVAVQRQESP